jgi:DNA ligase D
VSSTETFIEVGGRSVRVSSPEKVCYPDVGITKLELAEYYAAVGEGVMRALAGRPMAIHRFPGGLGGSSFYMKHAPKGLPDWVQTTRVTFPSGRTGNEVCVTEPATVVWAVQMNALELHPWPVRRTDTDHPDELRLDLDPQPGTDFPEAVRAAEQARALLTELGMTPYVKTSGGRGLHILVRIEPRWTFIQARRAVIALARELERRHPDLFTTSWWKEERGARIFADFNQMARDRMLAAAYSSRARPGATVSMPVRWNDLPDVAPEDFTVRTVPALFAERGDALGGIDDQAAGLGTLLEMSERDERDHGLGDLPYPPEFPKMPGEPKRVQPSKARRPAEDEAEGGDGNGNGDVEG